ncbi:hypothetical protein C4M93_04335, partial [Mycoplasmopsis pullorum]
NTKIKRKISELSDIFSLILLTGKRRKKSLSQCNRVWILISLEYFVSYVYQFWIYNPKLSFCLPATAKIKSTKFQIYKVNTPNNNLAIPNPILPA